MKKLSVLLFIALFFVVGCQPSENAIQTALAQTQAAFTSTTAPTNTPAWTNTPKNTNTPKPTNTPRPTPMPKMGTVKKPFPFQEPTTLTLTIAGTKSEVTFTVVEVIRGEEANLITKQANMFNDAPPKDMEYAFIKIQVTLLSGTFSMNYFDIVVASNGQLFDVLSSSVCCTESKGYSQFDANLILSGASTEGWIVRPVFINDPNPLVVLGVGYGNDITSAMFYSTSR